MDKSDTGRSLKKIGIIVSINIVTFLLLFTLVELTFRSMNFPFKAEWTPPENVFGQFDETMGWSYIPNKSTTFDFRERKINVSFDKDGIRVPHAGFQFDYSKPTVLFIGCSFTMGHGLEYDESFAGRFAHVSDMPYQVVNVGVQGYGSDQTLMSLRKFLLKFNTKVVVYTFISSHVTRNGNYDRRMLRRGARYVGTKPLFALDSEGHIYLKKRPLLFENYRHSYLVDFLKMRVGKLLGVFPPKPKELTRAIVQEMNKYSEDHGAHFVVINWRWKEKKYNYEDIFQGINTISTLVDAPNNWKEMRIPDDNHPNGKAGIHIKELLIDYFRKNNLM